MPKKIVYTCDKCGTEIIEGWLVYIERVRSHTEVDPTISVPVYPSLADGEIEKIKAAIDKIYD